MFGERVLIKAFGDAMPKLNEVLTSIHGFIRLNALIGQEIIAQNIAKNWNIPILQARQDAKTIVEKMQEEIENPQEETKNGP